MPLLTITVGSILVLLGLGSYLAFGRTSVTAMIPAFFGLPLLGLGFMALYANLRKHTLHAASVLVLIGFLGTVQSLVLLPMRMAHGQQIRPRLIVQAMMTVLCGTLLAVYTKSFIDARRRRMRATGWRTASKGRSSCTASDLRW